MSKNWDLKPGDITTAYNKGVYEVISVQPRWNSKRGNYQDEHEENEYSLDRIGDLVTLKRIYSGELKPINSKVNDACDSSYCTKISDIAAKQIKELERKIEFYKQFIPKDE